MQFARHAVQFLALIALPCLSSNSWATLIVDLPRPIIYRVTIQLIETALDDGTSPATVFGDASQRASIEAGVDTIWAQAGIDIDFLPTVTRYNNTFAYQGSGGARPFTDLSTILVSETAASVMNPVESIVNEFFVNIVPGFSFTTENTVNGISNIGADGTAEFVGDNLLGFQNGRDVISSVVAHEIGHVLGLKHAVSSAANLMSPNGTSQQLSPARIDAVLQTNFRNDAIAFIPSGGTGFPQAIPEPPTLVFLISAFVIFSLAWRNPVRHLEA